MKQSLGYANDRSVYNALKQSKITENKIQELFVRKGILCSSSTDREELAKYFSRLTHDLTDHKLIADSIGIIPRREKITSTEITSESSEYLSYNDIKTNLKDLEKELNNSGCTATYKSLLDEQELEIIYTEIDYSRSDFQQIVTRKGTISIRMDSSSAHIRSTQAKFINEIKEKLVNKIISQDKEKLKRNVISLRNIEKPELRTRFFLEMIRNISDYSLEQITQIGVYKNNKLLDENEFSDEQERIIANIDDAHLKGSDVHLTSELKLLSDKGFYYVKVIATLKGKKDNLLYTVDIEFKDKENCDLFSYIVKGISEPKFDTDTGLLSLYKSPRNPKPIEQIYFMDKLEESAKFILDKINSEL